MRYLTLITFAVIGMLAGCIMQPVYTEWPPAKPAQRHFLNQPIEPAAPDPNPVHAKPRLFNAAFNIVIPIKPQLQIDSVLPEPSVVVHVQLTGSGAEWSTLPFATNYLFTALVSNDMMNWVARYPTLDAAHSFYVTSAPPIFCNAYWQSKAKPGNQ